MQPRDYRLTGPEGAHAQQRGLADARWYQSPVNKAAMRALLVRRNWPALRDTCIWFALLGASGYAMYATWGTAWFPLPFLVYAVLYASVSDSRWHECSHGTAFKSDWLNILVYEISSFLVFRESTTWRWSHVRHHTDTIIVGRDPEIASPRPVSLWQMVLSFFKPQAMWAEAKRIVLHAFGGRDSQAATYVPESEWPKIHWKARIYLLIYCSVIALAVAGQSLLPLMYVGMPTVFGSWLISIYGYTQHAGLAEDVTDHRRNSRTVYMNFLNRFLYWNMNYHVEHHMYPLVPYHALPKLHALIKDDCPPAYPGLWAAWKEIITAWRRQAKDPAFYIERPLPNSDATYERATASVKAADAQGFVDISEARTLAPEDVMRVDVGGHTFAVYRTANGELAATEGICTHGNAHLANGLVLGDEIECPKHNGRFNVHDGSARRAPACVALERYAIESRAEGLFLNTRPLPRTDAIKRWALRVVAVKNLSTFIREIELAPEQLTPQFTYKPGDYLRLCIPAYEARSLYLAVPTVSQAATWEALGLTHAKACNVQPCMRNYSLATNPVKDETLKLNVRLAFNGADEQTMHLGVGSAYMYSLKPGDVVEAMGPQGDFRIKPANTDMVYLGGGAGMAPLKSHLSFLLETEKTARSISFWYGARNRHEALYREYFENLAKQHQNFTFNLVLSEPQDEEDKQLNIGFVHQAMYDQFLKGAANSRAFEYYLCGPPPMMAAARTMLKKHGVPDKQVAFDEF
ncbi:fatty acid desaturase [Simiduia sp. 21SJ11W-1]|uniref:fatty acid desaturase n=1 Tax=Simiduia sp. 21SJ11W-1 TaxID=2909669 RepID=UPI00209D665B|nr:fatty acid desaturase [Simiduia sp. 21SJ11W-1]UTA48326.1 fatty acid desaturase [Simiduia sp. 21SJ11W-1]